MSEKNQNTERLPGDARPVAAPEPAISLSRLNDAQLRIATTLDEPLFVEAGAGSGKTSTLTKRIAWALAPGSGREGAPFLESLDQVLVITFTEAAALEIKERVRAELRSAHMERAALAVDDAWISTIHGMCRRILSRHALDVGIDPSFSVVTDSRQAALFDRALNDVMGEARGEEGVRPVLREYGMGAKTPSGYTGVLDIVRGLVEEAGKLPGGIDDLSAAPCSAATLEGVLRDLVMRFEELGALSLTPAAAEKVGAALEVLRPLGERLGSPLDADELAQLLSCVPVPSASKATKEAVAAARSALALARSELSFERVRPYADVLLDLARRVADRYDAIKLEERCLDNDDLVRRALLAVRSIEEVRRDYAGRFRLVMVDEFQDTDAMQLELISLLAGDGARHLCTVGDAQQSIYRFRGADVGVFRGRGERVAAENVIRLDVNYRSHADVLALVERVCTGGGVPGVRGAMPEFMHLDPNPSRGKGEDGQDGDAGLYHGLPRVDIEVCAGRGGTQYPTAHQVHAMAAQVADALAGYRDRGVSTGGMALLLGSTTHTGAYLDAIRARGMECVVTGGSTFTSTSEVEVVCALLHALANPRDTRSGLFPLLASEMFGLDANDFCDLGTRPQEKLDAPAKRSIGQGLHDMVFFHDHEPSARLAHAHEVIERALEDVRWRPVADVCADVVRDSGWLARLEAGGSEGLSRAANVLAAVRFVRDLTGELGLGAARAAVEFDRWLAVAKVPPASLAGAGESGGGPVRVMTVHASKGLEFPVVAVAECWSVPSGGAKVALGRSGDGKAFVLCPSDVGSDDLRRIDPEELEESADRSAVMPLAARFLALRAEGREEELQEKARLLYVALTRAEEALVVGVSAATKSSGEPLMRLAGDTLDALSGGEWVPAPGVRGIDYGGSAPARLRCVVVEKSGRERDAPHVADSGGTLAGFDGPLPGTARDLTRLGLEDAGEGDEAARDAFALYEADALFRPVAPGTWRAREGVFSYSSVHAALAAGREGRPPAPSSAERDALEAGAPVTDDADRATNLGSAFHEVAQAMVESGAGAPDSVVAAQVRRWNLSPRAEARLRAALGRWEGSRLRAEALSWPRVRAEVPFFQRVDSPHGDYLEGAMDLLCTDEASRRALVVDYKTGDAGLSPDEVRERHAMQAEFYAGVLLAEGYGRVDAAFVCVERDDPDAPGEPLVARYAFEA